MNYIAHLHIADASQTDLVGNFLGDFVKGEQWQRLAPSLQIGVLLHRKVDQYTDAHSDVVALRRCFPPSLRRTCGIALDVYFDYLLLRHWWQFNHVPFTALEQRFYRELARHELPLGARWQRTRQGLLQYRWLDDYQQPDACLRALKAIEKRFSRPVHFAEASMAVVEQYHSEIEQRFLAFYPQLLSYSQEVAQQLLAETGI